MVDVFEQVEEELRSDRYKRLAKTWLPIGGAVLALALILALAWWGWDSWQSSKADKASVAYDRGMVALEANDTKAADEAFAEVVTVGNGPYKALGLMQRAGIAVSADKTDEAVALFDEAAKATREPILSDAAALKAVFLLMDRAPLADLEKRLEPLLGEKRPLRAYAQEAKAMSLIQHGKGTEARAIFVLLQLGQDVPEDVRARAQAGVQAIDSGTAPGLAAIVSAALALESAPAQTAAPAATEAAPTADRP